MSKFTGGIIYAVLLTSFYVGSRILAFFSRKKARLKQHLPEEEYDERQELYRGKAFRYGFYTIVVFCLFDSYLFSFIHEDIFEPHVELPLAISLGTFVILEYELWNDVNTPVVLPKTGKVKKKRKSNQTLDMIVTLIMFGLLALAIVFLIPWKHFAVDGKMDLLDLLFILFVMIVIYIVSCIAHGIYLKIRDRE